MYRISAGFLAGTLGMCSLVAGQTEQSVLDGVTVANQVFDASAGTLTFEIRNDSRRDLVAWVSTRTIEDVNGRVATTQQLTDESVTHALATAPGLAYRPVHTAETFIPAGNSRTIVERLRPPRAVQTKAIQLTTATASLSAVVFADGRAFGNAEAIGRIDQGRKQLATDYLAALNALKTALEKKSPEVANGLRLSGQTLSKRGADMVTRAADTIDKQPDAVSRERVLGGLIQTYEATHAALTRPIVLQ